MIIECKEFNWSCKHIKKIRSSQAVNTVITLSSLWELLQTSQNSEKNTSGEVSFLWNCNFLSCWSFFFGGLQLSQISTQRILCEFQKIFKNIFLAEHLRWLLLNCIYISFAITLKLCEQTLSLQKIFYFLIVSNSRFYTVKLNRQGN